MNATRSSSSLFLESERLDVLIEPGVPRAGSLVVVVEDVPERGCDPSWKYGAVTRTFRRPGVLNDAMVGLLLGERKPAQCAHVGPDRRPVHVDRVAGIDQLLRLRASGTT